MRSNLYLSALLVVLLTSTAFADDPTSGTFADAGGPLPQEEEREFTPPGANNTGEPDWVLVLDHLW